jgi:hydroxypyruvate reductase
MAQTVDGAWMGTLDGVVITPYGTKGANELDHIKIVEASHPAPDESGVKASTLILDAVSALTEDDLVICLISGGGSALMTAPKGITLGEKANLMSQFLACGATINEINTVRKHLSGIKGGRLAEAAIPARVISLIVSDVVGDDLSVIASGPTVPDPSTFADALEIISKYKIEATAAIAYLKAGIRGKVPESPKPGSPIFEIVSNHLIVNGATALEATAASLRSNGYNPIIWDDSVEGDSRVAAKKHAAQIVDLSPGEALISGGETTVQVNGTGIGGPNHEFILSLADELAGTPGIYGAAIDTDGKDGTALAAGAMLGPDTLARATLQDLDVRNYLKNNDAYTFFKAIDDLVITGPTGTNVNDLRIILHEKVSPMLTGQTLRSAKD